MKAKRIAASLGALLLAAVLIHPAAALAQSSNIGTGAYAGSISYASPGVPRAVNPNSPTVNDPCTTPTFTISGSTPVSATFVFNTALSGYLGTLNWTGTGQAFCETALGGSGSITLTSVSGTGPTNSNINCATSTATRLSGGYTRTATDFEAVLGGDCTLNASPPSFPGFTARVSFTLRGAWVPAPASGVTTSTNSATVQGVILVQPA